MMRGRSQSAVVIYRMRRAARRAVAAALTTVLSAALLLPTMTPIARAQGGLPDLGQASASDLSPAMERKLGERIMRDVRADPNYVNDLLMTDYVNALGDKLVAAARKVGITPSQDFEFFVVRDRTINAFSMPGGFVGVHTGLIVATRTESELASVLGHEIGHVLQHHIARMVGQQGKNMWVSMASLLFGVLAGVGARSADLGQAIAMGGQALAIDRTLHFSRDAEREADRVGFQLLQAAGFDTYAMPTFFERLQRADAINEAGVPAYVRTHPLTTERIADMLDRARHAPYRQPVQSPEYAFVRARARVIQEQSASDYAKVRNAFRAELADQTASDPAASWYGVALASYKLGQWDAARQALAEARKRFVAASYGVKDTPSLAVLAADIARASGQPAQAERLADAARRAFPLSQAADYSYGQALMAERRIAGAVAFFHHQTERYRNTPIWWKALATAYAAQGKQALQHQALAEQYALQGQWSAAISQLKMARDASDADFYELSTIDARLHEFERRYKDDQQDEKDLKNIG